MLKSPEFYVYCSHLNPSDSPRSVTNCELMIFRKGVKGNGFVNLWRSDGMYMNDVAEW